MELMQRFAMPLLLMALICPMALVGCKKTQVILDPLAPTAQLNPLLPEVGQTPGTTAGNYIKVNGKTYALMGINHTVYPYSTEKNHRVFNQNDSLNVDFSFTAPRELEAGDHYLYDCSYWGAPNHFFKIKGHRYSISGGCEVKSTLTKSESGQWWNMHFKGNAIDVENSSAGVDIEGHVAWEVDDN